MPQHSIHDLLDRETLVHATPTTTVHQAAQSMAEHRCGSLLVVQDEQLVGIFTAHDLLTRVIAKGRDPKQTRLHEVMTPDPATITADTPVEDALWLTEMIGCRYLPVVEDGRVVGVFSKYRVLLAGVLDIRHQPERGWV